MQRVAGRALWRSWAPQSGTWRVFSSDSEPFQLAREGPRPDANLQRREALRLYRDVLRSARHFTWRDKDGVLWRDKLVASARKEFEDARYERDPDIIARLLIGGQDALIAITDRMLNKARKLVDEEKTSSPGLGDGWAHANAAVGMGEMQSQQQGGAIPYGSARNSPPGERLGGKFGDRAPPHGVKEGKIADEIAWKRDWEQRHNIQGAGARNENSPSSWLPKAKSPWTSD